MSLALYSPNRDYIKMIESATKAPSGHNSQAWSFKVFEEAIEIYPNFDYALPIVDGNHRELYISLGCASENLCIAAHKLAYKAKPEIIQELNRYIIRIGLSKNSEEEETLFEQIEQRQSNRNVYLNKTIANDTLQLIGDIDLEEGVNMYFYAQNDPLFQTISEFVLSANKIQFKDKAYQKELKGWMRFNKKQANKTRDGLSYSVLGFPPLPFGGRTFMGLFHGASAQNKSDRKRINSSSHIVLFTTKESNPLEWIKLGRTLERFLLQSTKYGIASAFLNQPIEVTELAEEMKTILPINNEAPMVLVRIGYAKKAAYSLRKPIDKVIVG